MSIYVNNEYIVSSNNSMNENKYNSEKMKSRGLRALLRPLMRAIKKSVSKPGKQRFATSYEEEQNSSNESLERELLEEMQHCAPGAAILVYDDGDCRVVPASCEDAYVPVHFARTSAGTFFWTSVSKAEADLATPGHCYTECQSAEQQIPHFADRWVQA